MMAAAVVHDYDHPGVNNDFLIKTRHPLAVTHNVSPDVIQSWLGAVHGAR